MKTQGLDIPAKKSIVVHLRTGDGLKTSNCWFNISDCYAMYSPRMGVVSYALPRQHYESLAPMLPKAKHGYDIVLVAALHVHDQHKRSAAAPHTVAYLQHVRAYFQDLGYPVHNRYSSSTDPDADFVFMASATTFVQGGGGYSGIIAQVVEAQNGTVLRGNDTRTCSAAGQFCRLSEGNKTMACIKARGDAGRCCRTMVQYPSLHTVELGNKTHCVIPTGWNTCVANLRQWNYPKQRWHQRGNLSSGA